MTPEEGNNPIRVALVEHGCELRIHLSERIERSSGFKLAGAFASSEEALEQLPQCEPDVVLMEIHLPGLDGAECVRRLKPGMPRTEFMMLAVFEEHQRVYESLMAGATGYLFKHASLEDFLEAVQGLHAGESPMSASIARKILAALRRYGASAVPAEEVSLREEEILGALAGGRRPKDIADDLGISLHAVRTHLNNIYRKLQVRSRAVAVLHSAG